MLVEGESNVWVKGKGMRPKGGPFAIVLRDRTVVGDVLLVMQQTDARMSLACAEGIVRQGCPVNAVSTNPNTGNSGSTAQKAGALE